MSLPLFRVMIRGIINKASSMNLASFVKNESPPELDKILLLVSLKRKGYIYLWHSSMRLETRRLLRFILYSPKLLTLTSSALSDTPRRSINKDNALIRFLFD